MDLGVGERLEVVWKKLEVWEGSTRGKNKVIRRWRYRSRKVAEGRVSLWNRFLPEKLQRLTPLYDDLVEIAVRKSHGARVCGLKEVLERCCGFQEGCGSVVVEWDDKWINPLSLASKGWAFESVDERKRLVCRCRSCCRTIVVDLNPEESSVYLRRSCWLNGVVKGHGACCPWRNVQFNLDKEYYLNKSNLVHDIERISRALKKPCNLPRTSQEPLSPDQLTQLKKVFHYDGDDQLLALLVRGYEPIGNDVVRCSACFRKAFLHNYSTLNYHESWCRYRDENKLTEMILSALSLDFESCGNTGSVEERLHNLETYLEKL
ncbi:hypothetical protein HG537_0G00680 [Torulaspora globosa]|uniref:C3HC-type domain-containing protein n=1 Tax=Torulaspora globosa TaxID=48254 RepID=A0A7H9HVR0_9SACH|nr:hypothetical protein HG537_0G00680 [Torulaspora sp. CBS 2947]